MTPPKREDGTRSAVNLGSESSTRFSFRGRTTRCPEPAVVWDPRRQACEEVAGGLGGGGRSRGHLGKEGIRNAGQDFRTHRDSPWTASKDLLLPIVSCLRDFKRLQVVLHAQMVIGLVTGDWRERSKLRVTRPPHPRPEQIIAASK